MVEEIYTKMNSGENTPAHVAQIEDVASKAVKLMEKCIDIIKTTDEFDLAVVAKQKKETFSLGDVRLFSRMEEHGIAQEVSNIITSSPGFLSKLAFDSKNLKISSLHIQDNERSKLVHRILLPLISLLSACYEVIDRFPTTNVDVSAQATSKRGTRNKKPPPPRGMLSIQNYTDVAAFLEFTVCSCVLPNLENQVLTSVEDRVRYYLPKSLAGRIPQLSLLWGSAIQKKTGQSQPREVAWFELQRTVLVLGSFVLLDRFRPMLLPRHLSDLYAAIFQAEENKLELEKLKQQKTNDIAQFESLLDSTEYYVVYEKLLPHLSQPGSTNHVDSYFRARAYQSLLLRGTKAPLWLRRRVSKLLTDLASNDLAAVVQVFVLAATNSSEDMTGASMRLCKALVGPSLTQPSAESVEYQKRLCRQLVQLLDSGVIDTRNGDTHNMDPRQVAGVLTVWSALDLFPTTILAYFSKLLGKGLTFEFRDNENHDNGVRKEYVIHRSVRRIYSLLMCAPSSGNHDNVCKVFLWPKLALNESATPGKSCIVNIFGQLLRLASTPIVLKAVIKDEAVLCLRQLLHKISQSQFTSSNGAGKELLAKGPIIAAISIVYATAPSVLDLQGYKYDINSPSESDGSSLSNVSFKQDSNKNTDIESISRGVEQRAKTIMSMLGPLCETSERDNLVTPNTTGEDPAFYLPSRLFHFLLLLYFPHTTSSAELSEKDDFKLFPKLFYENLSLATMNLLPLLCESCPPHSLLLDNDDGSNGIMGLIKLILNCACSKYGRNDFGTLNRDVQDSGSENSLFSNSATVFCEILSINTKFEDQNGDQPVLSDEHESLLSIASVVLSMLIAILELGSSQRSEKEERMLNSLAPFLQALAAYTEHDASLNIERSSSIARADLAEMASHALALISSRSAPITEKIHNQVTISDKIAQAESDLSSEQPPIRARGVVSLRHIARGYLEENKGSSSTSKSRPLVEIINDEDILAPQNENEDLVLLDILRLSVKSLDDNESYVYLAGIQTLVAAADVKPRQVLPILARALCTGVFDREANNETVYLSNGQRVKLAEALLFTIRRRGKGIYQFVPHLLSQTLGVQENEPSRDSRVAAEINIQRKTHEYFISGDDNEGNGLVEDPKTVKGEQRIRVNTGGPLFDVEEDDLVRAAFISVLTELVSVSQPCTISRYCPTLMRLIMDVLHLDTSRPIRRTAALLCREMYSCVLREYDEMSFSNVHEGDLKSLDGYSLAVEMLVSGEEALFTMLQRCVASEHAKDVTAADRGKGCVYDPATVARCEEALDKRSQAANEGILAAANLLLESKKQDDQNPIANILRRERKDVETVRAVKGLSIDLDNLNLT